MLETLEAGTGQYFQPFSEGDLVLYEGGVGLEVFLIVGRRSGQRRTRLAV